MILYWIKLILLFTITVRTSITISMFLNLLICMMIIRWASLIMININFLNISKKAFMDFLGQTCLNVNNFDIAILILGTAYDWSSFPAHYEFNTLLKINIIVRVIASFLTDAKRQRCLLSLSLANLHLIILILYILY